MPITDHRLISTGEDSYGAFELIRNRQGEEEQCCYCGATPAIMLVYLGAPYPQLPEDIDVSATILGDKDGAIGVTCGCYAKFHRQVAHIADKKKQTLPAAKSQQFKPSIKEQLEHGKSASEHKA